MRSAPAVEETSLEQRRESRARSFSTRVGNNARSRRTARSRNALTERREATHQCFLAMAIELGDDQCGLSRRSSHDRVPMRW